MEEFLTVSEVAPRVKMSEQALYSAIREKQFPAVRIGARIRIPVSMLKRWIEEQSGAGSSQETNNGGQQ